MDNFRFYNPTRIIFGQGNINQIGIEAKKISTNALLVSGEKNPFFNKLVPKIEGYLESEGIHVTRLEGIEPNPDIKKVEDGVNECKKNDIQLVIAIGGGSVIDAVKAIAAGVFYDGPLWDMVRHGQKPYKPPQKSLPTIMIPTVAAAGSEMGAGAVISNKEIKQKCPIAAGPLLYPYLSILDPELTCSVPIAYTVLGAVDIISHALEIYLTGVEDTPLQDRMVEGLILTVMDSIKILMKDPEDISARSNLQWSSTVVWNGWLFAGCNMNLQCHPIEHVVSAYYGIAHGAGLAVLLPAWMKYLCKEKTTKLAQLAKNVFSIKDNNIDDNKTANKGIEVFELFMKSLNCKTRFTELGISDKNFKEMSKEVIKQYGTYSENSKFIGSYPKLYEEDINIILKLAL